MIKKNFKKAFGCILIFCAFTLINSSKVLAQVDGPQQQEIKWMNVSALHQWFSSGGAEIEYGRRGRSQYVNVDQLDGLRWPGEYIRNKGVNVGKSLWIGTTNFTDPVTGITYPYKVVCAGRLAMHLGTDIFADELTLIGKSDHPRVFVDDATATDLEFNDVVDKVDPSIPCDRILINRFHTSTGISVTRKVLDFVQQYNNNYFIYEYVFKNTGIINATGEKKLDKTLTDVVFHFQYRYGFAGQSYSEGWFPSGCSWGLNTINDCMGDPNHPGEFRAVWSYYGPESTSPGVQDDIGLPKYTDGTILAGTDFAGVVVLHADKSPQDNSDDPAQPFDTQFMPSDRGAQGVDQYDVDLMSRKYTGFMAAGHPAQTHAEQVGKNPSTGWPTGFANTWGGDAGGYAAAQGFGPYNLAPGDSIRIVLAEGVAGIMSNRDHVREIAKNWFNNSGPFTLPDGSTTTDRNEYKNTWVFSGKDSLFQTFRRAIANYNSNYSIPQPPPPPDNFSVVSGGDRIALSWSDNADSWPNFNGYRVYRAEGRPDTTFDLIFSCEKNNVVHSYDDQSARRGFNYFYYVVTKDDGSTNNIQPGVPLVSSKYYTVTNHEAFLTRPPGGQDPQDSTKRIYKLSEIRVVPNPYNIRAKSLQFGFDTPDRLAFYGLPPFCKIKIYTENGDLIETIDHNNGSGDELWHSLTSSRQVVVSGLYIAYFEVTENTFDDAGNLIYKQGDSIFKKFIIIR